MRSPTDFFDVRGSSAPKDVLPGLYQGRVESNKDPLQLGRLQIRIPALHGIAEDTPSDVLPWARPCLPFGGGHDYGTFQIPPTGSTVWVMFEHANHLYPVWMGTWPGIPADEQDMLRDSTGKQPKGTTSMSPDVDTPWVAPAGPEVPHDALCMQDNRPERYVPFKTVKGHTLVAEDRDEVEALGLVDRAGQTLQFQAAVKAGTDQDTLPVNLNNAAARGLRNAQHGDALPLESLVGEEALITLVDIGGQSLILHVRRDGNKLRITSRQPDLQQDVDGNDVTVAGNSETSGSAAVVMELGGSDGIFSIDITRDGRLLTRFRIDAITGVTEIDAQVVRLNTKKLDVDGDVFVNGDVTATGNVIGMKDGIFSGAVLESLDTKVPIAQVDRPNLS